MLPRARLELGALEPERAPDGARVHDPDGHAEDEEIGHEEEGGDPGLGLGVEPALVEREGDGDVEGGGKVEEALDDVLLVLCRAVVVGLGWEGYGFEIACVYV